MCLSWTAPTCCEWFTGEAADGCQTIIRNEAARSEQLQHLACSSRLWNIADGIADQTVLNRESHINRHPPERDGMVDPGLVAAAQIAPLRAPTDYDLHRAGVASAGPGQGL